MRIQTSKRACCVFSCCSQQHYMHVRVCVCMGGCKRACLYAWVRFVVVFAGCYIIKLVPLLLPLALALASVAPLYFVRNKIDDKIKMDNGRFSAVAVALPVPVPVPVPVNCERKREWSNETVLCCVYRCTRVTLNSLYTN